MVSLGGPALGLVMCIEENPSATSRLQWIALGFAGNNRVKTLVPDLRIAVVTESNVGICSVPKLPSRAKSLTRLKCRRRNSTRRLAVNLPIRIIDPAPLGAIQRWVFLQG